MSRIHQALVSLPASLLMGASLATLLALFGNAHLRAFLTTGKVSLLAFGIAETLVAILFLIRSRPRSVTLNPLEWVIAVLGTFLVLFLRPTTNSLTPVAEVGLTLGASIQILGLLSLNRSFALVPAIRQVKTQGMYRIVRHPIYSSYVISFSSYLLANFSIDNLLIVLGTFSMLIARIHLEERHLSQTPEYQAYQEQVRWRLIPFVF